MSAPRFHVTRRIAAWPDAGPRREDGHNHEPGRCHRVRHRALSRDVRDHEEAALWAQAADDPEFRSEMQAIATVYGDLE